MVAALATTACPPDGGWGWMVVIGVALTNTFNQSLVSIFGLLFSDHLEDLGQNTVGVALVMNLNSVFLNLSGLFTGPAIKMLSTRKVAFFGSLLTGSGLILCSISKYFWQFLISYGIIVGFGLGLISSSTFIAVNSYFKLRRGRAVGFALAGTGVGQMIMPHIVSKLLDEYGYRGASLIMGGLAFHGLVGACLCQPVKWHMKKENIEETKYLLLQQNDAEDDRKEQIDLKTNKEITTTGNLTENISFWEQVKSAMDLNFLKDPTFLSIAIGLALVYTASINFSMIFPYYLQKTAMLNRSDAALCMSVLAGADLVSRLTLPTLTDKLRASARITFLFGTVCLMTARTILAMTTHKISLIFISGIYGYIRALTVVNQSLTISEYCTQEKLPGAFGINMVIKGIFVISLGQVLGWVRDYFESYSISLYAQNTLLFVVIIFWSFELIFKYIKKSNQSLIESFRL